ncbi:FecR family protein [Chitinimonas sp. PSY-7]|uniref:FecR domain-containing protein n=1 Tax=Chitinimonas sp. PSY-7 TaxID=3459088 RepID=UPI00403FE25D
MKNVLILATCVCLATPVWAAGAATVTNLAGVLSVRKADGVLKILSLNSMVDSGDLLATGPSSYARLKFVDGSELTLRPNTELRVDSFRFEQAKPDDDNAFFRLIKGGLRAVTGLVGKRSGLADYRMTTPTATIGIRGTNYGALYCQSDCGDYRDNEGKAPADGLYVDVADGLIMVSNDMGSQQFLPGQYGFTGRDQAPVLMPQKSGVPIATDTGTNKPPEAVLGDKPQRQSFECTIE